MTTCHWCGDTHGQTALCQRAQCGMTRRSFCFLFGAGVAGLAIGSAQPDVSRYRYRVADVAKMFNVPPELLGRKLYRTTEGGNVYKLIATINDHNQWTYTDDTPGRALISTVRVTLPAHT